MATEQLELKELLDYDKETGVFTWKTRQAVTPHDRTWNTRFAGKVAGSKSQLGYWVIMLNKIPMTAHRLAFLWMTGEQPEQVDHQDHNRSNNIWSNLRATNKRGNMMNQPVRPTNKLGIHGVLLKNGKYTASIKDNGKKVHLYYGNDFFEACCARKSAEVRFGYHPNHGSVK